MKNMKEVSTIAGKVPTKLEKVTKNVSAKTQVNNNTTLEIKAHDNSPKKFKCSCCGNEYAKQEGNFMPSNFETFKGNSGFITTCKKCTDQLFSELTSFYMGNEEKAIDHICQMFGIYFNESPLAASKKISANRSRLSTYSSKVQIKPWIGKTYLDTVTERVEAEKENIIESFDDIKDIKNIKQKTVKFFGLGFSDDEYRELQEQYDDWTARHECKTKAQEELFKNLCIAQLNIRKAQLTGGKVPEAMKAFQDLMGSANLKPAQTNDNALADQNTFGTLIKKWENEKPIPEPDDEWKDVDGIVRYITVYFLGHLCKMMGIKNTYSRMYDNEMAKYKIEKPEYEDDDEALFDAVFGGNSYDEQQ